MPIYEYRCTGCAGRFRKLVGVIAKPSEITCPRCGSSDITRLISRFSRVRSEDETLDSLADEMESMGDAEDPKTMRRLVREMGKEMGEDMEDDFEQMLDVEDGASDDADDAPLD